MNSGERAREAAFLRDIKARLGRLYHDLNNPLAIASGNVQLIEELMAMGESDGVSEAVADARQALDRFGALLDEFLAVRAAIDERLAAGSKDPA